MSIRRVPVEQIRRGRVPCANRRLNQDRTNSSGSGAQRPILCPSNAHRAGLVYGERVHRSEGRAKRGDMKVFLSYQHSDVLYAAHALHRALMMAGVSVFLDDANIESGEKFWSRIRTDVSSSHALLALIGPNFDASRLARAGNFVAKEWTLARHCGCHVQTVLIDREHALAPGELPATLRWITELDAHRLREALVTSDLEQIATSVLQLPVTREPGLVRLLWVDDDPAGNEAEREMLRAEGVICDVVVSNREACTQLSMSNYDLIVTDIGRRKGSDRSRTAGLDLLTTREVAELGPPVIIYTYPGFEGDFSVEDLRARGAFGATSNWHELERLVLLALGRSA